VTDPKGTNQSLRDVKIHVWKWSCVLTSRLGAVLGRKGGDQDCGSRPGRAPPCRPPLSEEGRRGGAEDETNRTEPKLTEPNRGGERGLVAELARGEADFPTPASPGGLPVLPLAKGER